MPITIPSTHFSGRTVSRDKSFFVEEKRGEIRGRWREERKRYYRNIKLTELQNFGGKKKNLITHN